MKKKPSLRKCTRQYVPYEDLGYMFTPCDTNSLGHRHEERASISVLKMSLIYHGKMWPDRTNINVMDCCPRAVTIAVKLAFLVSLHSSAVIEIPLSMIDDSQVI
jgi:hypothetical protein